MLQLRESDVMTPGLLACLSETRIGPLNLFGATCTEPLSYVSGSSHRASIVSSPQLASDLDLYTQADPIGLKLVSEGLSFFAGGRRDDFAYVRANPLSYTDPVGLETTIGAGRSDPCSYYDDLCRNTGCSYPCKQGTKYCRLNGSILNIFDSAEIKTCIRDCLIGQDSITRFNLNPRPSCRQCNTCPGQPQCINERCITEYHTHCFQSCGSRSFWPGLFPGPGIFFPGKGC